MFQVGQISRHHCLSHAKFRKSDKSTKQAVGAFSRNRETEKFFFLICFELSSNKMK
jgi:hypothetical protein